MSKNIDLNKKVEESYMNNSGNVVAASFKGEKEQQRAWRESTAYVITNNPNNMCDDGILIMLSDKRTKIGMSCSTKEAKPEQLRVLAHELPMMFLTKIAHCMDTLSRDHNKIDDEALASLAEILFQYQAIFSSGINGIFDDPGKYPDSLRKRWKKAVAKGAANFMEGMSGEPTKSDIKDSRKAFDQFKSKGDK